MSGFCKNSTCIQLPCTFFRSVTQTNALCSTYLLLSSAALTHYCLCFVQLCPLMLRIVVHRITLESWSLARCYCILYCVAIQKSKQGKWVEWSCLANAPEERQADGIVCNAPRGYIDNRRGKPESHVCYHKEIHHVGGAGKNHRKASKGLQRRQGRCEIPDNVVGQ